MSIFDEIKSKYMNGDVLRRLLIVNCGMFVLILLTDITFTLIGVGDTGYAAMLFQFPWSTLALALRPWTPITALFTSWGLWHFIFNMLILYWMGGIFQRYFTNTHLRGLYIIGGFAGMIGYTCSMLIPFFRLKAWTETMPMASACILALAVALAFREPDHQETIPVIGPVKIKYIVIALALIDIALFPRTNPATDLAHAAAAASGYLFNRLLGKGIDMTRPVTAFFVWINGFFTRKRLEKK